MARARAAESGMFTKADYETLVAERRRLNDLITTMDKAEACGVSCAVFRQQVADIDAQLQAIQTHFMTPPPK